ncbi:hypothetical protein, partial [Neoroseomonas rubea]|uniref:hypothetical protein n=1 Tax=Neoroseomonas rubea TaxID=2748666 RepID=UPI0018DFFF21
RLAAAFAARAAAEDARIAAAAPARRALDLVGLADGLSPALGRFAERLVYSPRLRALIGR